MYPGEKLNTITHLVGAIFAVAATSILVTMASIEGNSWKIVSFSVYRAMMIFLYATSTITIGSEAPGNPFSKDLITFPSTR